MNQLRISRRAALLGLTAAWQFGGASLALADAPTNRRFIVIILRGALDGLAAVVPYGDPNLAVWRADLVPPEPGTDGGLLDLGGRFGLHPALAGMHDLFKAGELLPVHAVAGHYRSRSHFEAQDYLESGADQRMDSGWLNRAVAALPPAARGTSPGGPALAVGVSVPLLLRGRGAVGAWAPTGFAQPSPDLYARIAELNHPDPVTGPAIAEALRERGFATQTLGADDPKAPQRNAFPTLAGSAGRMLAAADGPRVAALEVGGWDTHAGQRNRLVGPLTQLDAGLVALKTGLGDAWRQTAVLVVTEFGRTVRVNGTGGTDHGTGTVAFIAGGGVAGGRVGGTWPGLAEAHLFENRDLAPTTDVRALAKGLLAGQFGLSEAALEMVFPGSGGVAGTTGLVRV
jgi:uncharacterized protein (DUF1501 family)